MLNAPADSPSTPHSHADALPSLWRHRDFRRYLTGQTAGVAGSSISSMAIPMLAVLELHATTGQVAMLAFLGQLPPALLALHAGALADRYSKRRQMIIGDLASAAALATVPLAAALGVLTLAMLNTLWALYLLRVLEMSATSFGVVLGLGALGAAAGTLSAPVLARRYGPGPMMLGALALTPLTQVPLLLASPGIGWETVIGGALFLQLACAAAAGTTQRSIRQIVTEDRMQARMQTVSTWLTSGARPLGALLAGGLGTWAGVRPALAAGAGLLVAPLAVLACSPLRGLRQMPDPPLRSDASGDAGAGPPAGSRHVVPAPGPGRAMDVDREGSMDGERP
ncbi:MFS transporter [Streptomyces sp. NPDC051907]|uniref:MFS transporter n=1 Tax=Streptomyces sp. NPDC051907 TaxID=3155284 RepID=UPI0034411266